jgi:hypothetical protein
MSRLFLQWWLVFVTQLLAIMASLYFGGLIFLLNNDVTYLSFVLIIVWLITSSAIGYKTYQAKPTNEKSWFISESCMTVGMIGTVVGFIYMLSGNFADINPEDINQMREIIGDMATGMGTALLTTLVGLIASLFLKIQLVNQDEVEEGS